ncbi:MAG TPA: alpha/beta hydrolase, partial [Mycobacterium sp.]|nr:alpha/beta hydrolase [Mycobacterium sp.]
MTGAEPAIRSTIALRCGSVSYLDFSARHIGSTVVLLHGGGVDSAALSWSEVGPGLAAAGHRVIAPDHPGHGKSPLPAWRVTQQRLVEYVAQFVEALDLDRYAIGGLSLGGGLAIGHVLERPERATSVLLLDSYGLMPRLAGARQALAWVMQRTGALDAATRWMATNRSALTWSIKSVIR